MFITRGDKSINTRHVAGITIARDSRIVSVHIDGITDAISYSFMDEEAWGWWLAFLLRAGKEEEIASLRQRMCGNGFDRHNMQDVEWFAWNERIESRADGEGLIPVYALRRCRRCGLMIGEAHQVREEWAYED